MTEADEHNDRVVNDETDEDTEEEKAKDDAHFTSVVVREHEKVDADNVGRDLVEDVLVIDDPGLPLPLYQRICKHQQSAYQHDPDAKQWQGRNQNNGEGVDNPPQREHQRVHDRHVPRMIQFEPIVQRLVPDWLPD